MSGRGLEVARPDGCGVLDGSARPDGCGVPDGPARPDDAAQLNEMNQDLAGRGLWLERRAEGLTLVSDNGLSLCASFVPQLHRLEAGSLGHELLVRAARTRCADGPPQAIDATAGLGEDALLLAAAGFDVTLFERDRVIAALLRDALLRAREHQALAEVVSRMHLVEGDSIPALESLARQAGEDGPHTAGEGCSQDQPQPQPHSRPDVVYLDPMFPASRKSAAVKKKAQLLRRLESPCNNEAQLLQAALLARPRKVVVKRPLKGPWLAGKKPSYSLAGKAVRFDVIVS